MTQANVSPTTGAWIQPRTARILAGGGFAEAVGGAVAVILSIVALSGMYTALLLPIAAICIGFALLVEGAAIASRFRDLLQETGSRMELGELGGGLSAEFVGGVTGVVMGVLALIGVAPLTLMSVTAIIFGVATLLGAAATWAQRWPMVSARESDERVRLLLRQAVSTASALEVLSGLAALLLGILGLTPIGTVSLPLAAFLIVGLAILLSGTIVGTKMSAAFQR